MNFWEAGEGETTPQAGNRCPLLGLGTPFWPGSVNAGDRPGAVQVGRAQQRLPAMGMGSWRGHVLGRRQARPRSGRSAKPSELGVDRRSVSGSSTSRRTAAPSAVIARTILLDGDHLLAIGQQPVLLGHQGRLLLDQLADLAHG